MKQQDEQQAKAWRFMDRLRQSIELHQKKEQGSTGGGKDGSPDTQKIIKP